MNQKAKSDILTCLQRLGFSGVCVARPPLAEEAVEHFCQWLDKGFAGEMSYLARRQAERLEPQRLLASVQSVLVAAFPYDPGQANTHDPTKGNIARYAWGEDYHEVLQGKLRQFSQWFEQYFPQFRLYLSVDAQPVLEKAWAQQAGLGWLGKNTNILRTERGSYFFLAVLLTDLPLEVDSPMTDHCGDCQRCLEICPTGALVAPYVLDARLCISYLTIEAKGAMPRHLRSLMGNHIFGCDDCQEVCPWNRFSRVTEEIKFFLKPEIHHRPLAHWLQLGPEEFKTCFAGSPVLRAKWRGFMRNVLVAAGNSGDMGLIKEVKEKMDHEDPLVRLHAIWAYGRLAGSEARSDLERCLLLESVPEILQEIQCTLEELAGS